MSNDIAADRLSYPITYWNGLGILVGLGLILGLHLAAASASRHGSAYAATAGEPVLATALYLTLSRGAIVATAAGVLAYAGGRRPWTLTVTGGGAAGTSFALRDGRTTPISSSLRARHAGGRDQGMTWRVAVAIALGLARGLRALTCCGQAVVRSACRRFVPARRGCRRYRGRGPRGRLGGLHRAGPRSTASTTAS